MRDGQLQWQDQRDDIGESRASFALAQDGIAYVAGTATPTFTGLSDLAVRAYDAATGAVAWDHQWDAGDGEMPLGMALLGKRLAIAGASGNAWFLRVLDAATGALLWQDLDPGAEIPGGVAAGRGLFLVSGSTIGPLNYDLLTRAYDARTGAVVWERRVAGDELPLSPNGSSLHPARVLLHRRQLVVAVTCYSATWSDSFVWATAYDADTGEPLWTFGTDTPERDERAASLAQVRNRLLVGGLSWPLSGQGNEAMLLSYKTSRGHFGRTRADTGGSQGGGAE